MKQKFHQNNYCSLRLNEFGSFSISKLQLKLLSKYIKKNSTFWVADSPSLVNEGQYKWFSTFLEKLYQLHMNTAKHLENFNFNCLELIILQNSAKRFLHAL